ncbi:prevent-host-death protein [Nostoc sp. FACHB-87]|uniref:prevent-host-death protein n=1 Tax=Nostocaceae TaxID=1162 RepID=UPI001684D163|nr:MULTISPECIES: prevent-host-death protein [Nostocaceae]MBD2298986.1 prevent-host-death protein [Nostoc sp. FACHB-190]MBD2453190.1 prevent-host-death protein [Nostoc sp. FACHB-87]MBD2475031.1 prevent-host-death protein [Anabaena sp. FACHB-83]
MKWTLEEAQTQLSLVINATTQEPQLIYTQEELVAAVVDPELFQEFLNWRRQTAKKSLSQVFQELQQLCVEENYSLEIPARSDRYNPFIGDENE